MKVHFKTLAVTAAAVSMFAMGAHAGNYDYNSEVSVHTSQQDQMQYGETAQQNYKQNAKHESSKDNRLAGSDQRELEVIQHSTIQSHVQPAPRTEIIGAADVMDVQESLNDEGYNLAVDGILGPRTENAILSFQRQNDNLKASGTLTGSTVAELDVDVDGSRDM